MSTLEIVFSIIGILVPVVIFMLESYSNKHKKEPIQINKNVLLGNNNFYQQCNTYETNINVSNIIYPEKKSNSEKDDSYGTLICICCIVVLFLFYIYLKYSNIINFLYVVAFIFLMVVSSFSPMIKKDAIKLYIINVILLIFVIVLTNKNLWNDEMIFIYFNMSKQFNINSIIECLKNYSPINFYKVLFLSLLQLFVCVSTVSQCILHLYNLVYIKTKNVKDKAVNNVFASCIKINCLPFITLVAILFIIMYNHFFQTV